MLLQQHNAAEAINDFRSRINSKALLHRILPFSVVVMTGLALWVFYNQVRWHTINDIGYNEWYKQDAFGSGGSSPFQLRFFRYEFRSFFLALPLIVHHRPWLIAPSTGQSLLFTSPALALAFFARGNRAYKGATMDSDGPSSHTIVHLLRKRLCTIRHATCSRLRTISLCANGHCSGKRHSVMGESAVRLFDRDRHLGNTLLARNPALDLKPEIIANSRVTQPGYDVAPVVHRTGNEESRL